MDIYKAYILPFSKRILSAPKVFVSEYKRSRRRKYGESVHILLYPQIDTSEDLNNYVSRLKWYLHEPEFHNGLHLHVISENRTQDNIETPEGLVSRDPAFTLEFSTSLKDFEDKGIKADLVLCWDSSSTKFLEKLRIQCKAIRFAKIEIIDTTDVDSKEYGILANLSWKYLSSKEWKKNLLENSYRRLMNRADWLRDKASFVLLVGTGPSFSKFQSFRPTGGAVIGCNSVVQSKAFFEHMKPSFVAFGDGAHHAGPTIRAQKFRDNLRERLIEYQNFLVVTTDKYAPMFWRDFPEHRDRFVFLSQGVSRSPNFQLATNKYLPALDSVVTIHMVPVASLISHRIFLLGMDGFDPNGRNEDFWPHHKLFEYEEGLEQFHRLHPTFDHHRKTQNRGMAYEQGLEKTLVQGERSFQKEFIALAESFSPPVMKRYQQWIIDFLEENGGELRKLPSAPTLREKYRQNQGKI